MTKRAAADVLGDTLEDWGVNVIFGMPGDGPNGTMEALRTWRDAIRFVQVRHEEAAAFMACGYAKHTGRLGVCLATSGPGGLHLLNGLYDAQIAHPDRQPVGDSGFAMLMAEFATCVKYDLPVKVVVVKNNTLGQIKWEQMVFLGNPEYGCALHPIDFAAFARACGGTGSTSDDPATCGDVLEAALWAPGPALVEAVVDPFAPPLPANITLDQAAKSAQSLARGEPDRLTIAVTSVSSRVRELI